MAQSKMPRRPAMLDAARADAIIGDEDPAAIAAVAQRYAYKGSQKWLTPKLEARFGAPQLEA